MDKPQFQGNPRNDEDLASYELEVRTWEQAKADAEYYDELYKADEPAEMSMEEAFGRFADDPEFREKLRGPEGLPGMNGAPGKLGDAGADGADGADATNFTTTHAYSIGPAADQTLSATAITVDVDNSRAAEPAASWSLSADGEWTWNGGVTATFLITWNIMFRETAGSSTTLAKMWLQVGGSTVVGTTLFHTVPVGGFITNTNQAIVDVADTEVIRLRTNGSGIGTTVVFRGGSNITLTRLK